MGTYYNPPSELGKAARLLQHAKTYEEMVAQLNSGETLFAHYHRLDLPFDNAPHLFSRKEFDEFARQERIGRVKLAGYYAMPATAYLSYFGRVGEQASAESEQAVIY